MNTTESVDTTRDTVGERLRRNRETISASSVVNLSVAEFNELRADLLAQRTMWPTDAEQIDNSQEDTSF